MLKINGEKFDKAMEKSLDTDEECQRLISQIRGSMDVADDSLVNSFIVKIYEIAYQRAFKDGMNFIIKREEINLF